jgi:hypothetical protein
MLTVLPDSGGAPRPRHTYTEYKQLLCSLYKTCTANEGPVRIQYKCLVPIYLFPEMKLCSFLFPKQNYIVLSAIFHIHIFVSDLYIPRIGLLILLQIDQIGGPILLYI